MQMCKGVILSSVDSIENKCKLRYARVSRIAKNATARDSFTEKCKLTKSVILVVLRYKKSKGARPSAYCA